jgi:hypothetical protein
MNENVIELVRFGDEAWWVWHDACQKARADLEARGLAYDTGGTEEAYVEPDGRLRMECVVGSDGTRARAWFEKGSWVWNRKERSGRRKRGER